MKKSLLFAAGLTIGLACSVAPLGLAHPHQPVGPGGPGIERGGLFGPGGMGPALFRFAGMLDRLAEELELSEAQREQVRAIIEASRDDIQPIAEALRENHRAIRSATNPDSYDAAVVAQLAAEQGDLVAELIVLTSEVRFDIASVLTPEQRDQLRALRQHRFGG